MADRFPARVLLDDDPFQLISSRRTAIVDNTNMAENDPIDNLKPPFSTYDFFGHLIPGVTFLVSLYIFEIGIKPEHLIGDTPFAKYRLHLLLANTQPSGNENALRYAAFLGAAVVFIYAISHVISSISSFFIDRLLIYKGFGYPYSFLVLGENEKTLSLSEQIKRRYYRGMFFWGNCCLLLTYFLKVFLHILHNQFWPWLVFSTGTWAIFFFLPIGIRWLIGDLLHRPRLRMKLHDKAENRNQLTLWPERLQSFSSRLFSSIETETPGAKIWFGKLSQIFSGGFDLPASMVQKVLRTDSPLEKSIAAAYCESFDKQFRLNSSQAKSNLYWFTLFYITERSPRLSKMITNWFHQYSFARNMAAAFYLAFVCCVVFICFSFTSNTSLSVSESAWLIITPLSFATMSVLMLIRFYYLYVAYYSRSLFRAFVFLQRMKKDKDSTERTDMDVLIEE